jgi:hypothetical protein
MSDRIEKLRATLHELEGELRALDAADNLDDSTRTLMAEAALEIATVLTHGERTEQTDQVEGSLRERLTDFEASHPQLAMVVGRLIDGLGQLGI